MKFPYGSFRLTNELYEFSGEGVISFVKGLDNALGTVMIFGHNNAFTNVVNHWGSKNVDNVPTTGLVHLKFNADSWGAVAKGTTESLIFPKHLK